MRDANVWRGLWLCILGTSTWACGDQLALDSAATAPVLGPVVVVRTRPVCGNGVLELGEACDDGNTDAADGCGVDCQRPCGMSEVELSGCGPGPYLTFEGQVERADGTFQRFEEAYETVRCAADGSGSVALAVCRETLFPPSAAGFAGCLIPLLPGNGGRLCASGCDGGCPVGSTCLLVVQSDGIAQNRLCVPAVGGGLFDECGACGDGLGCNNGGPGTGNAVCLPQNCDSGCPVGSGCFGSVSPVTGEPTGEACFPLDDGNSEYRPFPAPDCPEDVDRSCTYGSLCDSDCQRPQGCGLVAPLGGCEDEVLTWCERGFVMRAECRAQGRRCAFDPDLSRFDCLEVE